MGRRLRPATLYPHTRGSVLVPLGLLGLPESVEVRRELSTELSGRLGAPLARRRRTSRSPRVRAVRASASTTSPTCAASPSRCRDANRKIREAIGFDALLGS
ncbi:MAG TPA: hypothetical protein VD931_21405 [Baekduia sp.]|nr:hypothetical protein [Baekduia sp.]